MSELEGLPRAPEEGRTGDIAWGAWPGGAPGVVLVHGITTNHRAFLALGAALAARGQRVLAPDLRGRGASAQGGPYGLDRHADDTAELAAAAGLRRPVLAGHSLGAYVALAAAARHLERFSGLVLIDGGVWPPFDIPEGLILGMLSSSTGRLGKVFPSHEAYEEYWASSALRLPDSPERRSARARDLIGRPGAYRAATTAEAFEEDSRAIFRHARRNELLADVRVPVVVVRAGLGMTGDPLTALVPDVALAAARRHLPSLRAVDLPEANHYTVVEPPHAESVADAIVALAR